VRGAARARDQDTLTPQSVAGDPGIPELKPQRDTGGELMGLPIGRDAVVALTDRQTIGYPPMWCMLCQIIIAP
jgi:hypothetical protein